MTVYIQLTVAGTNVGPFNLYSNLDLVTPFASAVSRTILLGGADYNVTNGTTSITVISMGVCTNNIVLPIPTTTTTSTTSTSLSTSTSSTTIFNPPCTAYIYFVDTYNCDCLQVGYGEIINSETLTIGKWYYLPFGNHKILVTGFSSCDFVPNTFILDSSQQNNCVDVICPSTTSTTTSSTTTNLLTSSTTTTTTSISITTSTSTTSTPTTSSTSSTSTTIAPLCATYNVTGTAPGGVYFTAQYCSGGLFNAELTMDESITTPCLLVDSLSTTDVTIVLIDLCS